MWQDDLRQALREHAEEEARERAEAEAEAEEELRLAQACFLPGLFPAVIAIIIYLLIAIPARYFANSKSIQSFCWEISGGRS